MSNIKLQKYKTKQRSLVLDILKQNSDKHLTIEQISLLLIENSTPVGTTTIYRQTEKLISEGLVRKYLSDSTDKACYQYISSDKCSEHFHLKCTVCGKLFHANCQFLSNINKHIFEHHSFLVDNTRTVFYGVCSDCSDCSDTNKTEN